MGAMTYTNEGTSQNSESMNSSSETESSDDEIEIPIHFVKQDEGNTSTNQSESK